MMLGQEHARVAVRAEVPGSGSAVCQNLHLPLGALQKLASSYLIIQILGREFSLASSYRQNGL